MRLDIALVHNGICATRSNAARLIKEGKVSVNGVMVTKCAFDYIQGHIQANTDRFVSRAGEKLDAALEAFNIDVSGKSVLDVGASTGGFTDCLLARGAKRVCAVDVGEGQLAQKLRDDARVFLMENTNARNLTPEMLPFAADLAVMDVSFISQALIYPALARILPHGAALVTLVKPQFEVGRGNIGKNGIVRDVKASLDAAQKLREAAARNGFGRLGFIGSPIKGSDGNTEYLALYVRENDDESISCDK